MKVLEEKPPPIGCYVVATGAPSGLQRRCIEGPLRAPFGEAKKA